MDLSNFNFNFDTIKKYMLSKDATDKLDLIKTLELPEQEFTDIDKVECKRISYLGPIETALKSTTSIGPNVNSDLELITSYDGTTNNSIFEAIDKTHLASSKQFLKEIILNPIMDTTVLCQRQKIIKKAASHVDNANTILAKMKAVEKDITWIYTQKDEDLTSLYEMAYFTNFFTMPFNQRAEALTAYNIYRIVLSPMIGLFSPIVYFIIPYFILRFKFKIHMGFCAYIKFMMSSLLSGSLKTYFPKIGWLSMIFTLVFYFQGIFNSIEIAKAVYKISKFLTTKMNGVTAYISSARQLINLWNPDLSPYFETGNDTIAKDIQEEQDIDTETLQTFNVFSNFGSQLKAYKFFKKEEYIPLLRKTCMLDTVYSIQKLNYSFPKYLDKYKAKLHVENVWHPSLKNPIKNTITLDGKSMILTGPNAGGKSTLIKSMLLSVLFAQTLSSTNADGMELTPFYLVNSQMNIPDCKGKESLFEAEMYRSKANLDTLKTLASEGRGLLSIIFMDEIFNSTNPIEGISGAYAIAKNMATYPTNISVITTHYLYLTKLAKDPTCLDKFVNKKMNVNIGDTISYPYKVSPGISHQYIALELLKQNGFDQVVVDDALAIKAKLLASEVPMPKPVVKDDATNIIEPTSEVV